MVNNVVTPPKPSNEPILGYAPGSPERAAVLAEYERQSKIVVEVPCIINGEEIFTDNVVEQVMPHDHKHVIARVHLAGLYKNSVFYDLSGSDNVVVFTTKYYKQNPIIIRGPGAGAEVTAAGIISDIERL